MPWPTKAVMEQIYALNLWGTNNARFYSGCGSHDDNIVVPYVDAISSFLTSLDDPITVCDLGCGDFNVGKQLVRYTKHYIAVDIVSDLIVYNSEVYDSENLTFLCLNIAEDELPSADCVMVRQVLQHLSNQEIQQIINKLTPFKYVIITEHVPKGTFMPNKDIISGQGIRLKKQSGVNLLRAPFHCNPLEYRELLSIDLPNSQGKIITTCYTFLNGKP